MNPWWVALGCAVAAGLLTPWLRTLATSDSRWLRSWLHVPLAAVFGLGAGALASGWVEAAAFGLLAVAAAFLIPIDLAEHRLPDAIVLPSYPALFALLALASATGHGWAPLLRAAGAAGGLFVVFLALALINPAGLGFGDVKLSGLLGGFLGWLGWAHVLAGLLVGVLINAVAAVVVLAVTRDRHAEVPFGPPLLVGAALGAWFGPAMFPALA